MSYITKEMVSNALNRMKQFHDKQMELHRLFEIDFSENLGRRNVIMSAAQEKFFANEIAKCFPDAINDGNTGQPDIVIPSLKKELECKITTRRAKGGYNFQTDYETLKKKNALDYLYVLVSPDFQEFGVLFFEGLTTDDFYPPAPGSRGKSRMKKSSGMSKVKVLHGSAIDLKEVELRKLSINFFNAALTTFEDIKTSNKRFMSCSPNAVRSKSKIQETLERKMGRHSSKMSKIIEKTKSWEEADSKYKFILAPV